MRRLLFSLLVCLVLFPSQANAKPPSWTGNAELDAAFAHNNRGEYPQAFALFSKLHEQGVPMAGTMVGRYYEEGRGVNRNSTKAGQLYAEARKNGEALGTYHHARFNTNGLQRMTGKELKRLVAVLTKEAEKGNVPVQTVLAATFYFLSGAGPERSWWTPPEARRLAEHWMRKASEAGYAPAQINMRLFYVDDAQEWLQKAADSGYPPALKALGR